MNFTVIGAGAIGSTVGGYLARSGKNVIFVDIARDHVNAINRSGLTVFAPNETFTVAARATLPDHLAEPLEVVLLAVGSEATRAAVETTAPFLLPHGYIVSLQNGLNEPVIADVVGEARTVGAFINFSAACVSPGMVRYYGHGPFLIGELDGRMSARLKHLRLQLRPWGEVEFTDNIFGYLWTKFGYLNMLFASAMVDEDQADVFGAYRELMVELASEFYELALLEGIVLPSINGISPSLYVPVSTRDWTLLNASIDEMIRYMRFHQKPRSPLVESLKARKRPNEIYHIYRTAFEIAGSYGRPMKLSGRLRDMIHEVEEGKRVQGRHNLYELDAVRQSGGPGQH
jgi:2-dehydropantoate 2-reductase